MNITVYDGIMGTPALGLAVKAWSSLLDSGLVSDRVWPISHDCTAIVASEEKDGFGIMLLQKQGWSKETIVNIAWVNPWMRKRGVHQMMWQECIKISKGWGMTRISSGTFLVNAAMRATAKKEGRVEEYVTLRYDVESDK